MKLKKYRIVRDNYNGYEVQNWRLWFPLWLQGVTNTHSNIEKAKEYIKKLKNKVVYYE